MLHMRTILVCARDAFWDRFPDVCPTAFTCVCSISPHLLMPRCALWFRLTLTGSAFVCAVRFPQSVTYNGTTTLQVWLCHFREENLRNQIWPMQSRPIRTCTGATMTEKVLFWRRQPSNQCPMCALMRSLRLAQTIIATQPGSLHMSVLQEQGWTQSCSMASAAGTKNVLATTRLQPNHLRRQSGVLKSMGSKHAVVTQSMCMTAC